MNEKSKLSNKEEVFDVFRPDGDRDISSENYRLKKQIQSQARRGPIEKNHSIDATAFPTGSRIEPQTLILSGVDEVSSADNLTANSAATSENGVPQTTIRLETFRIGMEERLAAMQVAQQKAKDQLSELEGRSQGADKLPNP